MDSVCNITNETLRVNSIQSLWDTLKVHNKIPFTHGDSVAFLYRGNASSVVWAGDFNGWNPAQGNYNGTKIGLSNVWQCIKSFPSKARLDYKIVLGSSWITDPENPYYQYSGIGTTNSELRMPDWIYPVETVRNPLIAAGKMSDYTPIASTNLSYTVYFRVYTPAGYDLSAKLPVIYVTDGHEYSDDRLGSMTAVLDNLISAKRIKPVIAVFIDPRSTPNSSGTNRRGSEYPINKKYADFVCDELIPLIDSNYKTNKSPYARAILGTSLGGINSAYFGYYRSDVFRLIGINSPAFWYKPEIFTYYQITENLPIKIFMSTGTINDTQPQARQMKDLIDSKGYPNLYIEVPEGHSWGNWRALIDEMLIYFFEDEISTGVINQNDIPSDNKLLGNYPNPFNPGTSISYQIAKAGLVQLKIYDILGNEIDTLINKEQNAGRYEFFWAPKNLSSGVYLCRLIGDKFYFTSKIVLLK